MPVQSLTVLPETYAQFNACVHCGLCLPACPTYVETLDEADSPRGRIHLMKAAADGRVAVGEALFTHLDRCLVCRACETACPSGVKYHELIETIRPMVAEAVLGKDRHIRSGLVQWVVGSVLPHPKRTAAALLPVRVAGRMGLGGAVNRFMPGAADLAAAAGRTSTLAEERRFIPAEGGKGEEGGYRGSVMLLTGCVGSVVSGSVNAACVRVLSLNGFDVHVPAAERCCGAMAAHANDPEAARELAAELVESLAERKVDWIVSPIAGCSAHLKSLGRLLRDGGVRAGQAAEVAGRVRDVCELLAGAGLRVPEGFGRIERTVTYHDPCHLAHAQGITAAPRRLLALIPGLKVVPLNESDLCCGAAGPYSLNQPEMAARLGRRKAGWIAATGATELVTANVGCALQIARHLKETGREMPVRHVVELLAEAYG